MCRCLFDCQSVCLSVCLFVGLCFWAVFLMCHVVLCVVPFRFCPCCYIMSFLGLSSVCLSYVVFRVLASLVIYLFAGACVCDAWGCWCLTFVILGRSIVSSYLPSPVYVLDMRLFVDGYSSCSLGWTYGWISDLSFGGSNSKWSRNGFPVSQAGAVRNGRGPNFGRKPAQF